MNPDPRETEISVPVRESLLISLGFWLILLIAAALYGLLALAPKIVEQTGLRRQQQHLQRIASDRSLELRHLHRVAQAMQHDPDFVARVTGNEFALTPQGTQQIRVSENLGYDARIPHSPQSSIVPEPEQAVNWYDDFLVHLSQPTPLRRNWGSVTLILFLIAFGCMNESFFSGALGRLILNQLRGLFRRYRLPANPLDETS